MKVFEVFVQEEAGNVERVKPVVKLEHLLVFDETEEDTVIQAATKFVENNYTYRKPFKPLRFAYVVYVGEAAMPNFYFGHGRCPDGCHRVHKQLFFDQVSEVTLEETNAPLNK